MSERQKHRASLVLALFGVALMLAAAMSQTDRTRGHSLPNRESSRPTLHDDGSSDYWMPRG